jgi:hypothetical protein
MAERQEKKTKQKTKIMKNNSIKLAAAVAALLGVGTVAQATPITSHIDISGTVTLTGGSTLATATGLSLGSGVTISADDTSYSKVPSGTAVTTWSPLVWSPTANVPINPLWSFTYGLWTYSFDATSITVDEQTSDQLELSIGGFANITGFLSPYAPNARASGLLIINDTSDSGVYTFNFYDPSSIAPVPDGGTTVGLLGMALSGIALLRRKLFA